jgi:capsular polysaccharide biosynthesis protein
MENNEDKSQEEKILRERHHLEEDEIDLRDYIKVLGKRKWQIASIFGGIVILTIIISFLTPPVFQASNLIEVGKIKGEPIQSLNAINSVFSRETVLQQIRSKIQEKEAFKEKTMATNQVGQMFDIKESESGGNGDKSSKFIEIQGRAHTPEEAVTVVEAVSDILLTYHNNIFSEAKKNYEAELATIVDEKEKTEKNITKTNEEIARLENDMENYQREINNRSAAYSDAQGRIAESYIDLLATVKNQKESKESQLLNLEHKLVNLEQQIQSKKYERVYETKPTEIEVPATAPETRISPKRKQNVIIAGVLGIFLGILYAFGAEYFKEDPIEKLKVKKNNY